MATLPSAARGQSDQLSKWEAAGMLWLHGVTPNWAEMHGSGARALFPADVSVRAESLLDR